MPTEEPAPESAENPLTPPTLGRRGSRRARRRNGLRRRRPVAIVVSVTLLVLAVGTSSAVTALYQHYDGNLKANGFHVFTPDGYKEPTRKKFGDAKQQPLNILVMGDDSRTCSGCHIDNQSGGGSDTTILVHLSRDRKHAYGVSIPRDTMVDRPACANGTGQTFPAETYVQWNAAYNVAGPSCTIVQFEKISHIAIDDAIVVNFQGFKDMVDAVGGVQVCIPQEIDDRAHGIVLQPGTRTINGDEALSYVRERENVGDGSDLGRIKRQQAFIASMVHTVLSAGTLSAPFKVLNFLNAVTKNLSLTDNVASLKQLAELGYGFRNIGLDNIKFFTIPIEADPQNPTARVVLAPQAAKVFHKLKDDKTLPQGLTSGAIKAGAVPGQIKKHPGKKTQAQQQEFAAAGLCTS